MLFNVKDRFVEVEFQLFPACNIQIYKTPEPVYYEDHECWYGFYWEMMFDNGEIIEVSQNLAAYRNRCQQFVGEPGIDEATIFIFDGKEDLVYRGGPDHGIMTKTLEELRDELKKQVEMINRVKEPV